MNNIDPADFNWTNDLHQENFSDEKCITLNNVRGLINECQQSQHVKTQPINKEEIESQNSIYAVHEKCYITLGENKLQFSNNTSYAELKTSTTNYSGNALNNLNRTEEQPIDLNNFVSQETKENNINFEEYSLSNNKSSEFSSSNHGTFMTDSFHDKNSLDAETISLIRCGISGVYDTTPELFASTDYGLDKQEQVVPISNDMNFYKNENSEESFNFTNQYERKINDENALEDNVISNIPNGENNETIILHNDENISENNETSNSSSIVKEVSFDGEFFDKSLFFEEILAFTPGGQSYKLLNRNTSCSKKEEVLDKKQSEVSVVLNNCKKIRQIQCGIFIPEILDYDKEEAFNNWLSEEKEKTKSLFENFNIKINIKFLAAERELIKLDRHLKQYTMSSLVNPLEILEVIEKTDLDLKNLLFTHQLYNTVSKITNNCKGRLRVKSRELLMKFKSLLSQPKGINAEKYLNDLLIKNDVSKVKPDAPVEWIVHLLIFE